MTYHLAQGVTGQDPFGSSPGEHKQTCNGYQSKSVSEATPRLACSEDYAYFLKSNEQQTYEYWIQKT